MLDSDAVTTQSCLKESLPVSLGQQNHSMRLILLDIVIYLYEHTELISALVKFVFRRSEGNNLVSNN